MSNYIRQKQYGIVVLLHISADKSSNAPPTFEIQSRSRLIRKYLLCVHANTK